MKGKLRSVLTLLLSVVFVLSVLALSGQARQQQQARLADEQARQLAQNSIQEPVELPETRVPTAPSPQSIPQRLEESQPAPVPQASPEPQPEPEPEPTAEEPAAIDLAALRQKNADVVGWIVIPDTMLDYPLLQGEDNQYYLKHSWTKESNRLGSIYMDYRNDPALADFNTILYGHRMRGDDMFGSLKYYDEQSHWEAHPAIYLTTDEGVRRYDIFAAYEINITNCHTYRLGLTEESGQQAYIDYCTGLSVLESGIEPQPGDQILTLSTCTARGGNSDYRWIVQAVWQGE